MAGELEQATLRTLTHVIGHNADGLWGRQAVTAWPTIIAHSAVPITCPLDTNENVLATITIPAGAIGANGLLDILLKLTATNDASTKTIRGRLGGVGGTILFAQATVSFATAEARFSIENRNSQSSQIGGRSGSAGGTGGSANAFQTGAVDTSVETTLVLTGQLADGTDTLTLESYSVHLFHQA
jgi:hypothetical protein